MALDRPRIPTREERAAAVFEAERRAERDARRDFWVTIAEFWFWAAVGMALVAFSLHSTNLTWAPILFYGGMTVQAVGVTQALIRSYFRAQDRGDIG